MAKYNRNSELIGRYYKPSTPGLPDPNEELHDVSARACSSANDEIDSLLQLASKRGRLSSRSGYHHCDNAMRARIATCPEEVGMTAASVKFSKELGHNVPLSTFQSIRAQYKKRLMIVKDSALVTKLPTEQRGRPLLLGQLVNARVARHVRAIRDGGGVINRRIVMATAVGILKAEHPSLLKQHGGSLEIGRPWAESFLKRLTLVKQKGTKAARKLPENFGEVKAAYLERTRSEIQEHSIPGELVLNMDETGTRIVPVDNYTWAKKGAMQVPMVAIDDKRQISAVLACTLSGALLPPQLLYAGKTTRCHPRVKFPSGWDIWHSESHWCT